MQTKVNDTHGAINVQTTWLRRFSCTLAQTEKCCALAQIMIHYTNACKQDCACMFVTTFTMFIPSLKATVCFQAKIIVTLITQYMSNMFNKSRKKICDYFPSWSLLILIKHKCLWKHAVCTVKYLLNKHFFPCLHQTCLTCIQSLALNIVQP